MAAERVVLRLRHSAELKTFVPQHCAAPGASVAKVAMPHGVKANVVHGWRKLARERDGTALSPPGPALPAPAAASLPQFLPVSMAQTTSPPAPIDIQIELRRVAAARRSTGRSQRLPSVRPGCASCSSSHGGDPHRYAVASDVGADPILIHGGCGQKLGLIKQRSSGSCGARRGCGIRVRS